MLVLSRWTGQKIRIGDDIIVEVMEVRGGKVYLGIEAPRDVKVDREEIRIAKEYKAGQYDSVQPTI